MYCVLVFPEGASLHYMYDVLDSLNMYDLLGSLREPLSIICTCMMYLCDTSIVSWDSLREPPCITCMMY